MHEMTVYAHIQNGVVVNRVVFDGSVPPDRPNRDDYVQSNVADIGWTYENGAFSAPPRPARSWDDVRALALSALAKTDAVALRCFKSGTAFPSEWRDYVAELRDIVAQSSGDPTADLPAQPAYPAGT